MDLLDPTLHHLYVELARLDLLIHRRITIMEAALRRDGSGDAELRPMHMTVDEVHRLLQQPFGESLAVEMEEEDPADGQYAEALARLEEQIAAAVREGTSGDAEDEAVGPRAEAALPASRLVHLALACDLSRYELDLFLICLAPALDLRYERIYGFLQDDLTRRRATASLALDLLSPPGPARLQDLVHFSDHAPIRRWHLIEPTPEPGILQPVLLNQAFAVETSLLLWLLGDYKPGAALAPFVQHWADAPAQVALLTAEQEAQIAALVQADALPFVGFVGKDEGGRRNAMACLAAAGGAPLLLLDMQAVVRAGADPEAALTLFLRDARLTAALAAVTGWEAVLEDGAPPPRLFNLLCEHPGPVAVGSDTPWQPRAVDRDRRLAWVDFPAPDYVQRKQFLEALLDGSEVAGALDIAGLAGRFVLTSRQLSDAVASALDRAHQEGRALCNEDLFRAAREHSSPRLALLARKLTPRYEWEDLILPDDQITRLQEMVQMVQGRAQVLDEWGLGRKLAASYGVTALFAGSPGTGKTMAAEVIARVLGLDLYKIDLSGLISKYIGETEKNLERVFTEAEQSNAILFFDEADAVFGKRSEVKDAHDRYANIETSYLLQRMEAYDGVTILATNLRANLDEAFTRRLHAIVDFPFPDAVQRLRIWQALFPVTAPRGEDIDLELLARRFKIAGGSIRNVLVTAHYLASAAGSPVMQSHLLHATRRELQKLGRLTEERDFAL